MDSKKQVMRWRGQYDTMRRHHRLALINLCASAQRTVSWASYQVPEDECLALLRLTASSRLGTCSSYPVETSIFKIPKFENSSGELGLWGRTNKIPEALDYLIWCLKAEQTSGYSFKDNGDMLLSPLTSYRPWCNLPRSKGRSGLSATMMKNSWLVLELTTLWSSLQLEGISRLNGWTAI